MCDHPAQTASVHVVSGECNYWKGLMGVVVYTVILLRMEPLLFTRYVPIGVCILLENTCSVRNIESTALPFDNFVLCSLLFV